MDRLKTQLSSIWIKSPLPSRKLVIVLHGRGDSYHGFQWLPEAFQFQDVNYLMVNAPDPYYGGFSWYDLPPNQLPGIKRSAQLLEQLLAETSREGYGHSETVVFGFSQGCLMALEWGGRSAHRLAGFVAISGYCFDEKALLKEFSPSAKQAKWLVTHGTLDEVLPFETSAAQVKYLQAQGLPIEFHSFPKSHTIDAAEELPLIRAWLQAVLGAV